MELHEVLYSKVDGVATIAINHPETHNAIADSTAHELVLAFEGAGRDPR